MLEIKDLKSRVAGNDILQGLSLSVNAGEVHAIMGPNGSGKSTLAQVVAGHEDYEVTGGSVLFKGQDLLDLDPEESWTFELGTRAVTENVTFRKAVGGNGISDTKLEFQDDDVVLGE